MYGFMCGSRGGLTGVGPPGKSQSYRVPYNTGSDPLKNHKAINPAFNVGPHWPASEMPFKWRFSCWADDGPLIV